MNKYNYIVSWDEEDSVFVAKVLEFPSLAAHGDTQQEALAEIISLVDDVVTDLRLNGEPVPEPYRNVADAFAWK